MDRSRAHLAALLVSLLAGACADAPNDQGLVELDFDRDEPRPFVEFYLSPYAGGADRLYDSGLVAEEDGRFFLNLPLMVELHPAAGELTDPASDGKLVWDELKSFFAEHYYDMVDAPTSLSDLLPATMDAFELEVVGVMTTATRHVFVSETALRTALTSYGNNGNNIVYPEGTTFVADHVLENELIETTAMRKRPDGQWDFYAFDRDGRLSGATMSPPRDLRVPTQCSGCHLGSRLYEPEKSFPAEARPGPDGPRSLIVDGELRNSDVVGRLDEHRKRSDGILGLYGTIYVTGLMHSSDPDDKALLHQLGF